MPTGVTVAVAHIANKRSQGEVKPDDLSVRENEQNLPSAWRALKKQGRRPVICYLLWAPGSKHCGKNLA